MVVTAELRLWWSHCPAEVEHWWEPLPGVRQTEERTDIYLLQPDQAEIGIKSRGAGSPGGAEVKQLVAKIGECRGHPIELWVKSESPALSLAGLPRLVVHKARQARSYGADGSPDGGETCHIELAEVRCEGDRSGWRTLGFEATGTLRTVQATLGRTLDLLVPSLPEDVFASAVGASYPLWLSKVRNAG